MNLFEQLVPIQPNLIGIQLDLVRGVALGAGGRDSRTDIGCHVVENTLDLFDLLGA